MLHPQFHVGIVESRLDPLKLGRVRVRVFGVHSESIDDIPVDSLPWAIPLMPATSASISGIGHSATQYLEGTLVFLFFQDGESKQQPIILGSAHGIPLAQTAFSSGYEYESGEFGTIDSKSISKVLPTAKNTLLDSSGTPVEDSSGSPIVTNTETCCGDLDTSKLVSEFGPNVTLVCKALCDFGISNPYAVTAILANIAKESKFQLVRESLKYTSVSRLRSVFGSKFANMTDEEGIAYVNNEELLANYVYANRYGNGSVDSGDGFKYRGGGFIQLTFKSNYKNIGNKIGINLIDVPNDINEPSVAAKAVVQYFIDKFGGVNKLQFSSLTDALDSVTRKVNPGGYFMDISKVKFYADKIIILNADSVKESISNDKETNKPSDVSNDVDQDASQVSIDLGTASKTKSNNVGFADPNGKWPLKALLKEQDTNRLSRRNTKGTSVDKKIANRRSNIRSIGGEFSEPVPPYNAAYPYNHVYATESGHNMEFDDTPGSERISLYHTSGTFTEIDKFGNQVNKIIGDNFIISERNGYVYIDGTARLTIGSDVKLVIGGNLDIEVDGDVNYDVGGSVNWKIGKDLNYGIGGNNSVNSVGSTDIDSSTINLNSGTSNPIGFNSRNGVITDYSLQQPENFIGADELHLDDADEEDVIANRKEAIASGTISLKDIADGETVANNPTATDDTKASNQPEDVVSSCSVFTESNITDTLQISKNFNLGMLSTKAAVSHYQIVAQNGLKKTEIACNLKNLAENCLDKIKSQFPGMFITSGFRQGGGSSQHTKGQAADMQFTGASKSDYFDIAKWIKDNVLYDQLLLEYKTTGTKQPWIHISYNSGGNRKSVMTFMNNTSVGVGLKQLGNA